MNGLNERTRKFIVIVAAAGLLLLYMLIFGFSSQDGEESGSLSRQVSHVGAQAWNAVTRRNWSAQVVAQVAALWEHPVRKLAHFSEYAVMGALISVIVSCFMRPTARRRLVIVAWLAVSAAADEFHQSFVPGRSCSFGDVLLDTCGGITGSVLCILLGRVIIRRIGRRQTGRKVSHGRSTER